MARFLETFATSTHLLPFRNFKFGLTFDRDSEVVLDAFWGRFGPSVESITLSFARMVGLEAVRNVLFNNNCPNLKSVIIQHSNFNATFDRALYSGTCHKGIAPVDENVTVNSNVTSFRYYSETFPPQGGEDLIPISWEEIFTAYPNLRVNFYQNFNCVGRVV